MDARGSSATPPTTTTTTKRELDERGAVLDGTSRELVVFFCLLGLQANRMTSSSQCSPTRFYSGHRDPTGCNRATGWLTNSRRLAEVPSACCPAHRMPTVLMGTPVLLGTPLLSRPFLHVQRTGCSWMLVTSHGHMSGSYMCSAQGARGCSWMLVTSRGPMSDSYLCSAQDARGCSWMIVLSRVLISDSYLCCAQDAGGCSAHKRFLPVQRAGCSWLLVDARDLQWAQERPLPVQRTGCSWMLVLSHGPISDNCLCSARDARGCSWMLVISH